MYPCDEADEEGDGGGEEQQGAIGREEENQ
jgi:hypothetical protein